MPLFALWAFIPYGWEEASEELVHGLVVLVRWEFLWLLWLMSVCLLGLLASLVVLILCGRYPHKATPGGMVCAGGVVAGILAHFGGQSPWTLERRVDHRAHGSWAVLSRKEAGVVHAWLSEVVAEGWVTTTYRISDHVDPTTGRSFTLMVRPYGALDGGWSLYFAGDGTVLAMAEEGYLFMLDGPDPSRHYLDPQWLAPSHLVAQRKAALEVSPWLLIERETQLHGPDIARLVQWVRSARPDSKGYPHLVRLRQGLAHPNPEIQRAAREILGMIPGGLPEESRDGYYDPRTGLKAADPETPVSGGMFSGGVEEEANPEATEEATDGASREGWGEK